MNNKYELEPIDQTSLNCSLVGFHVSFNFKCYMQLAKSLDKATHNTRILVEM